VPNRAWLDPLRRELDEAPRVFFFRDDDAGWATGPLLFLVDLFADYEVPLDLAVIPAALDAALAGRLRERRERSNGLLAFHQHGFAHTNHEQNGRPCEFGPGRTAEAQRRDIAEGARHLRDLLGELPPIFTPPWNRCTVTTGRCLRDSGFRVLVRDSSAERLGLEGLRELEVQVDWSARRKGRRPSKAEAGRRLADACQRGPTGVMLHHALLGRDERGEVERLLALLAGHENARCTTMSSLVAT
jgi:Polysaccharide deacetylase